MMRPVFAAAAVAAVALGGYRFYRSLNHKRKSHLHQKKLEVWEGEGGAVPVAPDRTAAQIAPQISSSASPGADG